MEYVLELQELDVMDNDGGHGGGGGTNSNASLLLCGNSSLSLLTCDE